jgi:hypothetical protein
MATKGGEIFIEFTGDGAKLKAELSKLGSAIKDTANQWTSSFGAVQRAMAGLESGIRALGVATTAGAMIAFVKSSLDMAAGLKTLSKQTGLSTQELQVWQAAARESGVSVDTATGGIEAFARTIGEATQGQKEAIDSLNQWGIKILDAHGNLRSFDDIILDAARHIAAIKDPILQARAATELFKRSGQEMLPVIQAMGTAHDEVAQHAKDSGQIISDAAIEAADQVENKWGELVQSTKRMVAEMAPDLKEVLDTFTTWDQKVKELSDDFFKYEEYLRTHPLINLFGKGGLFGPGISTAEMEGKPELPGPPLISVPEPATFPGSTGPGVSNPAIVGGGMSQAEKEAKAHAEALKRVNEQLEFEIQNLGLSDEAQQLNNELRQAGVTIDSQEGQRLMEMNHLYFERKTAIDEDNKLKQEAKDLTESLLTPQEQYNKAIEQLNLLYDKNLIGQETYVRGLKQIQDQLVQTDPAMVAAKKAQDDFDASTKQLGDDLESGLVDAFTASGNAAEKWRNLASTAIKDVLKILEQLLNKALELSGSGGLGDLFSGALSSIFGATTGSAAIVGPLPGSPLVMGSGGSLGVGDWAVVGERGPELVYADTPGNVLSADRTRGFFAASSASTANFHIDARGADMAAVARIEFALTQLHANFDQRAVAAVGGQRKRGGAFATTFRR